MSMDHEQLDIWFKEQAATQLDTFSKTITITATVWREGVWDGLDPGHSAPGAYRSGSTTASATKSWAIGYETATFNNDLPSGIGAGQVAKSQDVTQAIANGVRSAVDRIEARLSDASINAQVCHNSCHSNCHGSRGRR